MKKSTVLFIFLAIIIILLAVFNLLAGSVDIPASDVFRILTGQFGGKESWRFIILESRLPQTLAALLSGSALAASGLLLQTAFRNPLAGPDVFGINSGASLGVAIVMFATGGSMSAMLFTATGFMALLLAAFAGAIGVSALILFLSTLVRSNVLLLIIGLMVGYVASSAVSLLNFFATEDGVRRYVLWGMGNFGGLSLTHLPLFSATILLSLLGSFALVKPLNAMLLGVNYAESLGINTRRTRNILLIVTGLLTAIVTAFCGPISFIGLAVPHIARLIFATDNHRLLLPGTLLSGSAVTLLCNLLCTFPGIAGILPINSITPLLGAPVIIYVLLKLGAKSNS